MTLYEALIDAVKAMSDDPTPVPTGPVAGRVFRTGHVPDLDTVTPPYVTVHYPVTDPPALRGDHSTITRAPDAQVDVWQKVGDEKDEDAVHEQVRALLEDARLPGYDGKVLGCRVLDGGVRDLGDPEDGWLRHTILLRIDHVPD